MVEGDMQVVHMVMVVGTAVAVAVHTEAAVNIGCMAVAGHSQVAHKAVVEGTVVAVSSPGEYIGMDRSAVVDIVETTVLVVCRESGMAGQRQCLIVFHNWNKSVLLLRLDARNWNKRWE